MGCTTKNRVSKRRMHILRRLIFFWIWIPLILAGCQSNAPAITPTDSQIESASSRRDQTASPPAPTSAKTETTPIAQAEVDTTEQPAGCTLVSPRPTPGQTERSIFPPVSDLDWVYGPEDAGITLTEYSDFQ